jgi:hypothetical protein
MKRARKAKGMDGRFLVERKEVDFIPIPIPLQDSRKAFKPNNQPNGTALK